MGMQGEFPGLFVVYQRILESAARLSLTLETSRYGRAVLFHFAAGRIALVSRRPHVGIAGLARRSSRITRSRTSCFAAAERMVAEDGRTRHRAERGKKRWLRRPKIWRTRCPIARSMVGRRVPGSIGLDGARFRREGEAGRVALGPERDRCPRRRNRKPLSEDWCSAWSRREPTASTATICSCGRPVEELCIANWPRNAPAWSRTLVRWGVR